MQSATLSPSQGGRRRMLTAIESNRVFFRELLMLIDIDDRDLKSRGRNARRPFGTLV